MRNLITAVRQALIARLSTISTANGYLTNIGGAVRAGWFNEVTKAESIPATGMIVVQRGKGRAPTTGPAGLISRPGFTIIGAVAAGVHGYEADIEDIELDLLRCLVPQAGRRLEWLPKGAGQVEVGAPEPFPPGEGMAAATVLVPFHIATVIEG